MIETRWYEEYIKRAMDRMKERGKTPYEEIAEKVEAWCKSHYYCDFLVTVRISGKQDGYCTTEYLEFDGGEMRFMWLHDWWEGQDDVELCGFAPVNSIHITGMWPIAVMAVSFEEEEEQ